MGAGVRLGNATEGTLADLLGSNSAQATFVVLAETTATSGAATKVSSTPTSGNVGTYLQAPTTNTAGVYIGASDVTTSKYLIELAAGERAFVPVEDASTLYSIVAANTASQKLGGGVF